MNVLSAFIVQNNPVMYSTHGYHETCRYYESNIEFELGFNNWISFTSNSDHVSMMIPARILCMQCMSLTMHVTYYTQMLIRNS